MILIYHIFVPCTIACIKNLLSPFTVHDACPINYVHVKAYRVNQKSSSTFKHSLLFQKYLSPDWLEIFSKFLHALVDKISGFIPEKELLKKE